MDAELDIFKSYVNLKDYAETVGFQIDKRSSWKNNYVLRRGEEKICVTQNRRTEQWVYFSYTNLSDNGTIVDFARRHRGLTVWQLRQELRPSLGLPPQQKPERAPQRPEKIAAAGQPCRNCSTPVVRREHRSEPEKRKGGFYYEWWFACPKCRAIYLDNDAKRICGTSGDVFDRAPASVMTDHAEFAAGFNTHGTPAAIQPDPERWAAMEAAFVDDGRAPWG